METDDPNKLEQDESGIHPETLRCIAHSVEAMLPKKTDGSPAHGFILTIAKAHSEEDPTDEQRICTLSNLPAPDRLSLLGMAQTLAEEQTAEYLATNTKAEDSLV